jgi:hypothetical protein
MPANSIPRMTLGIFWHALRLPVLMLLVILEPAVSFVLGSAALLGVLMTFFWKLVGPPTFPFWTMLTISLGFGFALFLYQALIVALTE